MSAGTPARDGTTDALRHARRVDWRFLLPDTRLCEVAVVGAVPEDLRAAVEAVGQQARGPAAVLVASDPGEAELRRALDERLVPGGWVCVEASGPSSIRHAARTLRQAGLEHVRVHAAWPSCAAPTSIVPVDSPAAVVDAARLRQKRLYRSLTALIGRAGLAAVAARQGFVVARRPATPGPGHGPPGDPPVAAPLLAASRLLGRPVRGDIVLVTPRFAASRHVIALVHPDDGAPLVLKTPRLAGDDHQLRAEERGLASLPPGALTGARPELLGTVEVDGRTWLAQSRVEGRPLDRRAFARDPDGCIELVRSWLQRLPSGPPAPPGEDGRWQRLVLGPLGQLEDAGAFEAEWSGLASRTLAAIAPLEREPVPVVFEHGDVRPPNLLRLPGGGLAVVDWELAEPSGFPLHDLIYIRDYVDSVVPARRSSRSVPDRPGLAPRLQAALAVVSWMRRTASLASRAAGDGNGAVDPGWLRASHPAQRWLAALLRVETELG